MNKRLKMCVVLDLIKLVDKKISEIDKRKSTVKSIDVEDYRTNLDNQLVILKLAKDKGNITKNGLFGLYGQNNSYRIYKTAALKRKLDAMADTELTSNQRKCLVRELDSLNKRMDIFNKSKTVNVKLYEDLNLLKELK